MTTVRLLVIITSMVTLSVVPILCSLLTRMVQHYQCIPLRIKILSIMCIVICRFTLTDVPLLGAHSAAMLLGSPRCYFG